MTAYVPTTDASTRFLFEDADVRGEVVQLRSAFADLTGEQSYGESTKQLLGQFVAAAVLISNNLKYSGRIILQARSQASLKLVMVECTSDCDIRGIAQGDTQREVEDPTTLIEGGQLVITIERDGGQRYQGIIALEGGSLARSLDLYFLQSEQLSTRFWLATEGEHVAGLMLQQLPAQIMQSAEDRATQWHDITVLTDTTTDVELLDLQPQTLLHRLFHEFEVRVYEPKPVRFQCSCSKERCLGALETITNEEIAEILAEQGAITMNCEMCGTTYRFEHGDFPDIDAPKVLH